MSETKWTPGPWEDRYQSSHRMRVVADNGHATICHMGLWTVDYDEQLANMRLIAAAPDMYEALKLAGEELRLIHMKDRQTTYHPGLSVQIDLALARAEGRTP